MQNPATSPRLPATTPDTTSGVVLNALHWRTATKAFDPKRKLTPAQWETLEQALVLSPSSYGLQPWRFVVITDDALRAQLKPVSWGQSQITDASQLIVFAARTKVTEADVQHYVDSIAKMRGVGVETLEQYKQMMIGDIVKGPRSAAAFEWATRQCFIALGNLLTSAAMLGIDACPMEGFDPAAYDKILGLPALGYQSVVVCAVGFRSSEDHYAKLKKVRFAADEVVVKR